MLKNYMKMAIRVLLRRKFFTFVSLFGISFTLLFWIVICRVWLSFLPTSFFTHFLLKRKFSENGRLSSRK